VFDQQNALNKLEAFASLNGPAHYGLAPNKDHITLAKTPPTYPEKIITGVGEVTIFDPGFALEWSVTP
jgi:dihydroorotase